MSLGQARNGDGPAGPARSRTIRLRGIADVLRHVHENPGTTRADLARTLNLSRGSAAELAARLRALGLVEETEAEPTGSRGRPTRSMGPHPEGPVAAVIDISFEEWRLALATLGGGLTSVSGARHRRDRSAVLTEIADALTTLEQTYGQRLRAVSVSVTGTVVNGLLRMAGTLGWQDVDVTAALLRTAEPDKAREVLLGNDATLAGVAEARRGAARGASCALHLTVEVGIGGVLLDHGRPLTGALGAAGEFGHLPFGDPERPCPCGAYGCWDTEVDGRALVRLLGGDGPPPDALRTTGDAVLRRAAAGDDPAATAAVDQVARTLGRGIAGLVNALDPEIVTLSGLAAGYLAAAGPALGEAYSRGLMRFRRADPPPLVPARFPADGSLRGAAELAFDEILSEEGLYAWQSTR